ncbi:hypothetical protein Tco_1015201 [Tanacetum coccineum]|uniref:Uncharacterized protein n=1 Tax=Tanacetum coccineum TaxID=301880 RepID=A0ABQ5FK97_9ASTR
MAISVILVSSDSSEDSVGTPVGRVILFGTIPTTIPDITQVITPPTTQTDTIRSPTASGALQRRVMVLAPGQPIPYGRLCFIRFASSRLSSDHSLLASPSGMRSSHRLCSLVPSVHHSSTIFERPSHDSSSASHSRKRSRSPVASVPLSLPTLEALSYARADLLPSPKRIRSPETTTYLEDSFEPYVPREVGLGVDFEDEGSEPSRSRGADLEINVDVVRREGIEIDPEIQAEIDECFAYADALRDRGIDARVIVEAADREEKDTPEPDQEGAVEVTYETLGDLVQRFYDHTEAILVHRVKAIEGAQRKQGHRIVGAESSVIVLTERVAELERDNRRLRGTMSVESQRVDQLQRSLVRMQ